MQNQDILQSYVNNFRRHFSVYLRPSVGMTCEIFPAVANGAIFVFTMGQNVQNIDKFMPTETNVSSAFFKIPQNSIDIDNPNAKLHFSGTNVILEGNRIILIKGDDDISEWNDIAASIDVKKSLPSRMREAR